MLWVLGTIWLMFWPPVFEVGYVLIDARPERKTDAVMIVQWLHYRAPPAWLNANLSHGKLSRKEINHYADVREWVERFPLAIAGLAGLWAAFIAVVRRNGELIAAAQLRGLCFLALGSLAGGLLALWDWKVLFAWLHYPFFGSTSWRLSDSAYSLRLFPAAFWQMMSCVSLAVPMAMLALGWWIMDRRRGP